MLLVHLVIIVVVCLTYTNNEFTKNESEKILSIINGQGLYKPHEKVFILTAANFKEELYGKPYANLVEFYNTWCGFCQSYATTWKALALDIENWRKRIMISAFDCSNDKNNPICRDFEVLRYPTLRYFHENFKEKDKFGVAIKKGTDMQTTKVLLLEHMVKEQQEGRAKMLANIIPYSFDDLSHIYDNVRPGTEYVFLVADPKSNEIVGAEVAIELQAIDKIAVKYTTPINTAILKHIKLGISVFAKDAPTKPVVLDLSTPYTRDKVIKAIEAFLKTKNIALPSVVKDTFTNKFEEVKLPSSDALQQAREKNALRQKIKKMGDVVFQADLETALRYSLGGEVAMSKTITGEKYTALQKYLGVLVKYFPFGSKGQTFLQNLLANVGAAGQTLTGDKFAEWVHNAERPSEHVFSSGPQWMACEGSAPNFRRYPCGMWKLFHYLTVTAAEYNANNKQAVPLEVLDAVLGYVKNFFGCSDCSEHFQEMARTRDMKSVNTLNSSIMWLWVAHNAVNMRLAGKDTQDPEYPKIQFPSKQNCPTCYNTDSTWNLAEVLRYLKTVYSNINIRYIGSDTRILHEGLGRPDSNIYNISSVSSIFKQFDTTALVREKGLQSSFRKGVMDFLHSLLH